MRKITLKLNGGTCTGPAPTGGGAWHTGRIDLPTLPLCLVDGDVPGQCQTYETIGGTTGQRRIYELLLTPVIEKVNQEDLDSDGVPDHRVEILNWRWNAQLDLADSNAMFAWELDTDLDAAEPVDLIGDAFTFNALIGPFGAVTAR